MERFSVLPHTADVGVTSTAADLPELFANMAYGMFAVMFDLDRVREQGSIKVRAAGTDLASLLVNWLNELLYLCEVEGFVAKGFAVERLADGEIEAVARGERVADRRAIARTGIKAATYHAVAVERREARGEWFARVIFDA